MFQKIVIVVVGCAHGRRAAGKPYYSSNLAENSAHYPMGILVLKLKYCWHLWGPVEHTMARIMCHSFSKGEKSLSQRRKTALLGWRVNEIMITNTTRQSFSDPAISSDSDSDSGRIFLHQLSSHLESHFNCYFFWHLMSIFLLLIVAIWWSCLMK
jgi:hypothetical protein